MSLKDRLRALMGLDEPAPAGKSPPKALTKLIPGETYTISDRALEVMTAIYKIQTQVLTGLTPDISKETIDVCADVVPHFHDFNPTKHLTAQGLIGQLIIDGYNPVKAIVPWDQEPDSKNEVMIDVLMPDSSRKIRTYINIKHVFKLEER